MTRIAMTRIVGSVLLVGLLLLPAMASAQDAPKQNATTQTAIKDAAAARADVQMTFGFVPDFIKKVPDAALPGMWQEMKHFQMNPDTELSSKSKELIGLAVASQIPCEYCVIAHTEFARLNGATEEEIGEAVAMAGVALQISTFVGATEQDEAAFRADVNRWMTHAKSKKGGSQGGATMTSIEIVDASSALQDVRQTFGSVPAFIERVPPESLPGFWRAFKDLRFSKSSLDDQTKLLIAVAVSAQVPCERCVVAQSQFAMNDGSTDAQIREAIAMAGHVRSWSTVLNGMQVDKSTYTRDINRMVAAARENGAKAQQTARRAARANRADSAE